MIGELWKAKKEQANVLKELQKMALYKKIIQRLELRENRVHQHVKESAEIQRHAHTRALVLCLDEVMYQTHFHFLDVKV